MKIKNSNLASSAPDLAQLAHDIAGRAEALAAEITSLDRAIQTADGERVRHVGFRCVTAADDARQAAAGLLETAADLERITATAAPGVCRVPWGVCPQHGNTLTSSAGKTWCRNAGCDRTWDYDRSSLPCPEPARWTVIDQNGGTSVMCDGHVYDAVKCIEGVRIASLGAEHRRESA